MERGDTGVLVGMDDRVVFLCYQERSGAYLKTPSWRPGPSDPGAILFGNDIQRGRQVVQ